MLQWSSESTRNRWVSDTVDAEGNHTQYENDAFEQLVAVREDNCAATYTNTYAYDLGGNLTSVTDDACIATLVHESRPGDKGFV